jgi:hypothetical protein
MRAPGWLRAFFGWRWAPCVALIAASLSFIALILLLMPTELGGAANRVDGSTSFVRTSSVEQPSAPPEPARVAVAAALPSSEMPVVAPVNSAQLPPTSAAPPPEPVRAQSWEFAANIADRGDRPHAPAPRFSGH